MADQTAPCNVKLSMQRLKRKVNKQLTDKQRLEGSKFRILNEKLYTTSSDKAQALFKEQRIWHWPWKREAITAAKDEPD